MTPARTGLDCALRDGLRLPGQCRVAVLCNATTVSSAWIPTAEALARIPGLRLVRIFSPQHGFSAEKQDNMIASPDAVHPRLGVPITSLYGDRREPDEGDFSGIDALIIDLPDVGTRVYTFLVSAVRAMRVALARGVEVIVLDRPNPIGGTMDGPILEDAFHSFVGNLDIPLRHGLTLGEGCLYGALRDGWTAASRLSAARAGAASGVIDLDGLRIVTAEGWRRLFTLDETGLSWTMPSPNMPALETAFVYPGQVLLEGTNLSEGRGTTRPFELFGAPYLEPRALIDHLRRAALLEPAGAAAGRTGGPLAGALLRPITYEPTFNRYTGEIVRGFQLHVLDRAMFAPVRVTVTILDAVVRTHTAFAWREPPYEYEWTRPPIDLICGTAQVRQALDAGMNVAELIDGWQAGIAAFRERVRPVLLYDD
ncbi:MAG: DUF1343 domain-containing protein [Candidatus Eisenbacteria bacterium]